jgi:serine/threonine protein phosphatase 1
MERPTARGGPAAVPRGVRIYAVGDVHGRIDLLLEVERLICEDHAAQRSRAAGFIVLVGDYVDRGPDSRAVLDHLLRPPPAGFRRICLLGNHDAWLRDYVRGLPVSEAWLLYGGDATMLSYGVPLDLRLSGPNQLERARGGLLATMPREHRRFLDSLELGFSMGDYFFCHAGIRPGVPLEHQTENELLWIREPFLSAEVDYGKVVVHGHTIGERPVVRRNRVGIDTGAYRSGRLTALVLEGTDLRFVATGQD